MSNFFSEISRIGTPQLKDFLSNSLLKIYEGYECTLSAGSKPVQHSTDPRKAGVWEGSIGAPRSESIKYKIKMYFMILQELIL